MNKTITTRTKITVKDIESMIRMRQSGDTLHKIAFSLGFNIGSVFYYTKHVPHRNRHDGFIVIHKQTGKVLSKAQEYTSPAIERLMKEIGFNAKAVVSNYNKKTKARG